MGGSYRGLLKSFGFQAFLWTQFLGALNDNLYSLVVTLLAVGIARDPAAGSTYLALIGALFMAPFFLFSGYAGQLADALSKRTILIATKAFEILAMLLGTFALASGRIDFMLAVVFLMAVHSVFFSPAKYGIVPEMLPEADLSRANGLLEMTTFAAIILSASIGGVLVTAWKHEPWRIGAVLTGIAIAGTAASFGITRVPAAGSRDRYRWNPWAEIGSGLKRLYSDRPLWLAVLAISYFWFIGALLKMDLMLVGKDLLHADDRWTGLLFLFLAVGIGAGSLAAGRLSGDKVELGLVPLGSLGMAGFSLLLATVSSRYAAVACSLVLLGFSAGLFIVPVNAFLQQRSGTQEKGRLIATNNFLNTVGVLLASGALALFGTALEYSPDRIIVIFGLVTLAATAYSVHIVPQYLTRFLLWSLTHTIYRIRIVGAEHIPLRGPALLVSNHMSHVDGFLIGASMQRFVRFLVYRPYYELKAFRWVLARMNAIPIAETPAKAMVEALQRAREELRNGHVVCIFAEGAVSRSGNMLPFKAGFERILKGVDVPVIPVHLDRVWGSIFSFKDGRFFWKWPERIPFPVTVSFGRPLPATANVHEVRLAVMELGAAAVHYRRTPADLLHRRFIRMAKRRPFSFCMADSTGKELTFGKALAASLMLARRIRKRCRGDEMVGLLFPASVGGALSNIAAFMAGKVPVNLNFTAGAETMASAAAQSGIRTILTSRVFLSRQKLEPAPGMIFLEDILKEIGRVDRLLAALGAFLVPARILWLLTTPRGDGPDSLATVIFSSGTTGVPKGVMLSHHNIISNAEAMAQVFWVTPRDRFLGVLPFFHSFGFTCTLWFPMIGGFGVVYHPNPMDAKTVGELVFKYKATFLLSTPTFCSTYIRRCTSEEFASLRVALVGAERLGEPIARAFRDKYGLSLCEGYGCSEMAPVVSANVLNAAAANSGFKSGTVGQPIPGVAVKVVDPATREPMAAGGEGLLLVNGPNRMIGYLGQPERTAEALWGGWYNTGDIGKLDEDGFIAITDRLARFSKIGGEMVPHARIEEAINAILGDSACAVVSLPDEHKGERLAVLYTRQDIAPAQVWQLLSENNLPKLWVPKPENFYCVDALPVLGSGKLDLKKTRALAAAMQAGRS